jgi:hypothetical protein
MLALGALNKQVIGPRARGGMAGISPARSPPGLLGVGVLFAVGI